MVASSEMVGDRSEARAANEWIDRQIEAAVQRTLSDLEQYEQRVQAGAEAGAFTQERHIVALLP